MNTQTPSTSQHKHWCRAAIDPTRDWIGRPDPLNLLNYVCDECQNSVSYKEHPNKLPGHLFAACEDIDAALFSGDLIAKDEAARNELWTFLQRWARAIGTEAALVKVADDAADQLLAGLTASDVAHVAEQAAQEEEADDDQSPLRPLKTLLNSMTDAVRQFQRETGARVAAIDVNDYGFDNGVPVSPASPDWLHVVLEHPSDRKPVQQETPTLTFEGEAGPQGLSPLGEKFFGVEDPATENARAYLAQYRATFPPRTAACHHLQGENVCGLCVPDKAARLSLRNELYRLIRFVQDCEREQERAEKRATGQSGRVNPP